ncbi:hypothetical protein [Escherichia phage BF17]|uniref:Uncharacterized protein n=1 Tax=Escherichia phage fEgEco12 TaxID=3158837 RepID=A0AAU7PH61_9CAUD|nr:hypothetical protein Ecwhy1_118 [Escherichia phage Ecwhy_1]QXN76381.1 hypothetical protein [Escherichia phage BF17]WGM49635.1 hypothetical protein EcMJ_393 [Escherichia phage vB_Ec-M-J]
MLILQVMWIDIILIFVCAGYSTTASILYCISLIFLAFMVMFHKDIICVYKLRDKSLINNFESIAHIYPIGRRTVINIIMSSVINGFIALVALNSLAITIGIVVLCVYRIYNEEQLEKLVCQR